MFKMNTDGTGYDIMHTFTGQSGGDGANPVGSLTLVGRPPFGTTPVGVGDALGVLFGINTDGTDYDVLHTFTGGPNDGANPGDLIFSDSTFYGMTGASGGTNLAMAESFTPIPEPSSLLLVAAASCAALVARRCRKRKAPRSPGVPGTSFFSPMEPHRRHPHVPFPHLVEPPAVAAAHFPDPALCAVDAMRCNETGGLDPVFAYVHEPCAALSWRSQTGLPKFFCFSRNLSAARAVWPIPRNTGFARILPQFGAAERISCMIRWYS